MPTLCCQCSAIRVCAQVFSQRAIRDADFLILGLGHHFPGSLGATEHNQKIRNGGNADAIPLHMKMALHAFFPQNLNHTLAHLLHARKAVGQEPPEASVLLMGTTTPVAGCSRFAEPISLAQYVRANYDHRRTVDSPMWLSYARMNGLASWLGRSHGVRFLDLAAPSAMRPDGAMARFWPSAGARKEDCVHYCMPGVVDTIATMVYNWMVGGSKGARRSGKAAAHVAALAAAAKTGTDGVSSTQLNGGGASSGKQLLRRIEKMNEDPLNEGGNEAIGGTRAGGGKAGAGAKQQQQQQQQQQQLAERSSSRQKLVKQPREAHSSKQLLKRIEELNEDPLNESLRVSEQVLPGLMVQQQQQQRQQQQQQQQPSNVHVISNRGEAIATMAQAAGSDGGRRLAGRTKKTAGASAQHAPTPAADQYASGGGGAYKSRFFEMPVEQWLGTRGASSHLEKCGGAAACAPSIRLTRHEWWPFNCSG